LSDRLPYGRQWIDEHDVAAVTRALTSDFLTQGPEVGRFEQSICDVTGAQYAVAVANGTAALHLACLAAGVGPNDVGITSTNTFVASGNGIRYAGGAVCLADVDASTGHVTGATVEDAVVRARATNKRLAVIVPVDFAGAAPALHTISAIATREGARVIEDAAHSLGGTYVADGATFRAGSCAHADMAILSFHPVKHATTGEGGAVTTNDRALYESLLTLRTHGITRDPARLEKNDGPWYYEQQTLGFNYRITDIQCALGVSQLAKLPSFIARRRALARAYDEALASADLASVIEPLAAPRDHSAFHLYVVRVRTREGEALARVAERRKQLYVGLRERGIDPQVHYIPVHTQPDFVRAGFGGGAFSGADQYYASTLSLPMFPRMRDDDVARVVAALREITERWS